MLIHLRQQDNLPKTYRGKKVGITINREEAIGHIVSNELQSLSKEVREGFLLDWWSIDQSDPEFATLPQDLQNEILGSEEPVHDAMSARYEPLINEALKKKFLGVRNEYLATAVSKILKRDCNVEGLQEELLPCPCCQYKTLTSRGEYEICTVCYWEDDGSVDSTKYSSANHMPLTEAQENFKQYGTIKEVFLEKIKDDRMEKYSK
ncbi:CPCC family cysteine-rich protein [Paenibacillus sp. SI8]|uniref:CPCC family cysteine-rich protein n=1 Tax=unclassified Paenibacillus TaxID=185978 RepID=UPI003466AFAE